VAIDLAHAYTSYGPMVRRRCQQLLRDPEGARDAMHDVFVRLAGKQETLDDHALGGLLYRMATGICLNRLRDHRRHPTIPDDDLILRIAVADDPVPPLSARRLLDRLFSREPESTRTIAVLHLLDGYTLEEVAAEVGLSVSGVRYRLRALRTHIAELEETP
jgi:RNA polymerase sigma-70 factor (ECF subfamily)